MKHIAFVLITIFLTGCSSVTNIRDLSGDNCSWMIYREISAWSIGNKLYLKIEQKPGLNLARVTPIEYEGDIYLEQLHISSGGGGTKTFEIDLSDFKLKSNWEQNVYWIAEGSWDNQWQVMTHRGPLPQNTGRLKVKIEKRNTQQ